MAEDLQSQIEENASGPKRVSGDAGSVEQHSIQDQIAADRYLSTKQAASGQNNPGRGLRVTLLRAPSAE